MTVLTRWEPFREFSTLQDRMNRLFRESHNEGGRDESPSPPRALPQPLTSMKTSTMSL
jgi:hypothetical protein